MPAEEDTITTEVAAEGEETEDLHAIEQAIRAHLAQDDTDKVDERDSELEEYAQSFKAVYESQFMDYLKNLPKNASINVTSLPTKTYSKATFDQDSVNDSTTLVFYFDSVQLAADGVTVEQVNAYSFDRGQRCSFRPYLYMKYGPMYGTTLLCGVCHLERQRNATVASADNLKSEYYFLDLPVFLYRNI